MTTIIDPVQDAISLGIAGRSFAPPPRNGKPASAPPAPSSSPAPEPWRPFPVNALPEPIRSFTVKAAKAIGCDPSFIALPVLSASAAAIGNTRRVQLKRGWTEPAILWTAIVGYSGTLKTPAFKLAMRPVRDRQGESLKRHAEEIEQYKLAALRYEKELAAWKREKNTTEEPPAEPVQPVCERFVVSDTTIEALAPILQQNPRGVLLARDELAGWVGSFDRYAGKGGADAAHWLSTHNGESLIVDRKTGTPRTIYVSSASVSVTGGIQPDILRRVMGHEHRESGLMARILLAMPPVRTKKWTEADIDPRVEQSFASVYDRLLSLEPVANDDGDPRPLIVGMTEPAKAAWITFYNAHADEQVDLTGDLSAAWSKLEGYAARLALVVHLIRWAAGDATGEHVEEQDISAGVTLSRWFGNEARRVYASFSESDQTRNQRHLIEWIQRRGGKVSARDVTRALRAYPSSEEAEVALAELVDAGLGRWELPPPGPKGGQPRKLFLLTLPTIPPDVDPADTADADGTPAGDSANAGCVSVGTVGTPENAGSVGDDEEVTEWTA